MRHSKFAFAPAVALCCVAALSPVACSDSLEATDEADQLAQDLRRAPTIASVTPAIASTAGGITVDVVGTYLRDGIAVTFGGVASESVTRVSSTLLRVLVPAHAEGRVDVTLRDLRGRTATLAGGFSYVAVDAGAGTPPGGADAGATIDASLPPPPSGPLSHVDYASVAGPITNPERGFYHAVGCTNGLMSLSQLQGWRAQGYSLAMCTFALDAFVTSPISAAALDMFDRNMGVARAAGLKMVMRFAYNFSDNGVDAALPQLLGHLDQLAPYLAKNADVITVVQAGFIGSWGEWANSQHYGALPNLTAQNIADRKTIAAKLLQSVPVERSVQLRTPGYKRTIAGPDALTSAEAFTGTPKARLGHHNDCFLASSSDWGTYTNISVEYPYLAAETNYLPMGGETCNVSPPRSDCPTALAEMAKFHWSYLNADYHQTVLANFASQGCYQEIRSRLGYRLALKSGDYSSRAVQGGGFSARFTVQNDGWSAPFNPRAVELVFRHTTTGAIVRVPLATDPRRWSAGAATEVNETVTLPSGMPSGSYALLLALPDPAAALRTRAEYSIQLANGRWEAATGFNALDHTVMVGP